MTDENVLATAGDALATVGVECEDEIVVGPPSEFLWPGVTQELPGLFCVEGSSSYGAEVFYSPDGESPSKTSGVGGLNLVGENFTISIGGEDPADLCSIKRALMLDAEVVPRQSARC